MNHSLRKARFLFFLLLYVSVIGTVFFGIGKYTVVASDSEPQEDDRRFEQIVESIQAQQESIDISSSEVFPAGNHSQPAEVLVSDPSITPTLTSAPETTVSPASTSPTITASMSLTPSVSPSSSPQPTPSVSPGVGGDHPTVTPSVSVTPTPTEKASVTLTPTPGITITSTPPSPISTPVPTNTPIPTSTPEPAVMGISTHENPPTEDPKKVVELVSSVIKKVNMPQFPEAITIPEFVERQDQLYSAYQQQPWLDPAEEKIGFVAALGSLLGGSSLFRDKLLRLITRGFA